jgi:hypothetical protein
MLFASGLGGTLSELIADLGGFLIPWSAYDGERGCNGGRKRAILLLGNAHQGELLRSGNGVHVRVEAALITFTCGLGVPRQGDDSELNWGPSASRRGGGPLQADAG